MRTLLISLLLVALAGTVMAAVDVDRAKAERRRRIDRTMARINQAIRALEQNAATDPEMIELLRAAEQGLKDLDDDAVDLNRQANAPWEFIKTAFPWAAPFIAAGGAYAGGRKHGVHIERKRSSQTTLPPAGRAPGGSASPFTSSSKDERRHTPKAHPIPVEPSMSEIDGMREMSTDTFDEAMRKKP